MNEPLLVTAILIGGMILLMALGVSVSVSIGLPSAVCLLLMQGNERAIYTSAQKIFSGVDSFVLLAIPLFVLAGAIMNKGGIAVRLIDLAKAMTGRLPGALAHTNVVANMMFGSVSGSAMAGAAAVGSAIAPKMREDGYDMRWAAATNVASAPAGLLIPPSNTLIVYALVSQVSVGALFLAGYIPGILWGVACLAVVAVYARNKGHLRGAGFPTFRRFLVILWRALPSLGMVLVVIGGILAGFFTPTEAAAVSVVVSTILACAYRTVTLRDFYPILLQAARTSAVVIFLIGLSTIMSFAMTYARVPQLIGQWITSITDSSVVFLLIMMVLLLIIGIPLDSTPAVLIFTPIFLPIAVESYGISPIHFGIMMVFNMCIAVISPPSAPVLFVGAKVADVKAETIFLPLLWFYLSLIIMLLIIQFVPALSLWLPQLFGFM
ncbi:MAG: TRAP transporter large permease [Propionicimonas sp.]